jgi:hypothetical protein
MASETEAAVNGYLHQVLADGAKPFCYRSRLRALLGFPELGGVLMNFPKPPPFSGFGYVRPQFTGEFEFPDEWLTGSPRSTAHMAAAVANTEEAELPMPRRTDLSKEPERDSSGREANQSTASAAVLQGGQPTAISPTQRDLVVPGSAVPRRAVVPEGHIRPQRRPADGGSQPTPAQTQSVAHRFDPALQKHDVNIPGLRKERYPATASGETDPRRREIKPERPQEAGSVGSQSRIEKPRQKAAEGSLPARVVDVLPGTAAVAIRSVSAADGLVSRQTVRTAHLAPVEELHPTSAEPRDKPQLVPRQSRIVAAPSASDLPRARFEDTSRPVPIRSESDVGHRLPEPPSRDILLTRGDPVMRRPHPLPSERATRGRSETGPQGWTDATPSIVPAEPAPHPQVVVVNQLAGSGAAPFAFWERRHLSHLHVRIRR